MGKLGFILGAGVGYVLGARAGRERYEQIEQQARRVWRDPRVQSAKDQAGDMAQEKGAAVQEKAKAKINEVKSDDSSSTGSDPYGADLPTPNDLPNTTAPGPGA